MATAPVPETPNVSGRPRPRATRLHPVGRAIAIATSVLVFGWVFVACWSQSFPAITRALELHVTFPTGSAGATEPLVSTGVFGAGDFLSVKYTDPTHGVLVYDTWGAGGPQSEPFALRPGVAHSFSLEMPSIAFGTERAEPTPRLLRVVLDGRELLRAMVTYHHRRPDQVYFAVNPIGGTPSPVFLGRLERTDGMRLRGGFASYLRIRQRLPALWHGHATHLLVGAMMAIALGWAVGRLLNGRAFAWFNARQHHESSGPHQPRHGTFLAAALICMVAFAALQTGGTFKLLYPETFGAFYDYQAQSLLEGHLDVPLEAMCNEQFVSNGRYYGYFGITPAVLRLPFVAAHFEFGNLSRCFMLAYFAATLLASYVLLCHATRWLRGVGTWPSRVVVLVLTASIGIGSTVFYLGARSYTYHEAILSGIAFALWSVYCGLRYLETPDRRWWIGAVVCGLFAVHARPPAGLFSLFFVSCIACWHVLQASLATGFSGLTRGLRLHLATVVLAAAALFSLNGVAYLKFGTFEVAPFRLSAQYDAARLARFEGSNFHVVNFRHNFDTYVVVPDFRLQKRFPFVVFGSDNHRTYPEAKLDITEPTLAFPYAMPALFALAIFGGAWAALSTSRVRVPVLLLMLGGAPMALALFIATATSHRYTGDFCPVFIPLAAYALAVIDAEPRRLRRVLLSSSLVLTFISVVVTPLLALQFQGDYVWGAQPEVVANYKALGARLDRFFGTDKSSP